MSATPAVTLARLGEMIGTENLITEPDRLAHYEIDGLRPRAAVHPGTADEVAEIVRFALAEKLAVVPVGAGTKLRMGMPPRRYDLAIETTRLNRLLAYDPGDLTLSAECGISLGKLGAVLAEHRQILPLAVPFTTQTTIGGTLASGVDSPLRQFYGTARDFVLGMEFVTGEGARVKSGGRVVKNVAGYDLHKLMIGSIGTLAIITHVNFRTFPAPPASRGFIASFKDADGALELRRRIARSPLTPLTLEVLSPEVAQIFVQRSPETLGTNLASPAAWLSPSRWTLAAAFGGNDRVLERYAKDLTRMAEETQAASASVLGDTERPLVWGRLREFIPHVLECSPAATILKVSVLPTEVGKLLEQTRQIADRHGMPSATLARGVGVVYFCLLPPARNEQAIRQLAQVSAELLSACSSLGGHPVIQWCPSELKRMVDVWGPPRGDGELMQELKMVFDPQGILSPGRFLGGI